MSPPESKRVRAKTPKTKTGCITCKIRRVKCDEGKPFCDRCHKFGMDCDGYEDPNFRFQKSTHRSSTREIMPRGRHASALLVHAPSCPPSTITFQDGREYMYFLHFQEETAFQLAGPFNASLWNQIVLQSCQNEPSLRRLTAAVGALDKAIKLKAYNQCEKNAEVHQRYSLQQYGEALKGIQRIVSAQRPGSVRAALIASLLIYCFESMQGEVDAASLHMENALKLMHKQLSQMSSDYQHLQNRSPSPALEDDLVAAFVRLDNALMSRPYNSTAKPLESRVAKACILKIDFSGHICSLPHRFRSITQARSYLEHFQFVALPSLAQEFAAQINSSDSLHATYRSATDSYRTMYYQLKQWNKAFAPLYLEALTSHCGGEGFVAEAMLQVQALAAIIASQKICARNTQTTCDSFVHESREIIDLSRRVAAVPSFRKTFVFECGIVPGLFIVVVTCLDMNIRKEALQVLRDIVPRREGAWDSAVLVKIGELALQV